MRIATKPIALALVGAIATTGLIAFAVAQGPASGHHRANLPMSVAEAQTRVQQRATEVDANRDGFIAAGELEAFRAAKRAERMQRRLTRLDTNQDGRVSIAEFEAVRMQRLASIDADKDGQITREEMRAMHAERRGKRQGHHHGRHRHDGGSEGVGEANSPVDPAT